MVILQLSGRKRKTMAVPDIQISELEQTVAQNHRKELTSYENVTAMLQKAGLADLPPEHSRRKRNSGSVSTQSGSLDRTEVSPGESVETTYSQRLEWGPEDTILKIVSLLQDTKTIKFRSLIAMDASKIKVSRCFMSLLKLKHHGFIKITKDPNTLEIVDIALGPKFD